MNTEGKREFLLHRGMSDEEHKAISNPASLTHPDVLRGSLPATGMVNHAEGTSSWTPEHRTARNFANEYRGYINPGHVVSAWIPETHISSIPMQYGKLDENSDLQRGRRNYKPPLGPNEYRGEHEVIVDPDHNSRLATPEEVQSTIKPMSTLHGRINEGGKKKDSLGRSYYQASAEFLRDRLKHRKSEDFAKMALDAISPGIQGFDHIGRPSTDYSHVLPERTSASWLRATSLRQCE
jgi:hypothetical protein